MSLGIFFCRSLSLAATDPIGRQGTLDDVLVRQVRVPEFTRQGFLNHIVELVVVEDKVSISYPSFIYFLLTIQFIGIPSRRDWPLSPFVSVCPSILKEGRLPITQSPEKDDM